jgi:urease accessory protein
MALGEEWCFTRYRSINEVHIGTERVARDVLLLSQASPSGSAFASASASAPAPTTPTTTTTTTPSPSSPPPRTLRPRTIADKLAPYACYATLLLFGPATTALVAHFASVYDGIRQMQVRRGTPEALLWSFSPLAEGRGCIVRVAGTETDRVKTWLKGQLRGLEDVVGRDAYARAFV